MEAVDHAYRAEELMAYLDGELPPERALAVRTHLVECAACQRVVGELRQVSDTMAGWQVENPPHPLVAPAGRVAVRSEAQTPWWRFMWRPRGVQVAFGAAAVAMVVVALAMFGRFSAAKRPVKPALRVTLGGAPAAARSAEPGVQAQPPAPVRVGGAFESAAQLPPREEAESTAGPRIIRTVDLSIVAKDFDSVKSTLERILRDVSGFVGSIQTSDTPDSPRSVTATLRVPAARLDEALGALRGLGHVLNETQSGNDVTTQVRDVQARLANARNTEKRLNDLLATRTGNVASLLEVEREIARVRSEIERLDAERVNLANRVAYATVTLQVKEERHASLDTGPIPLRRHLRNAFVDGVRDAFESAMDAMLWVLRSGPTLLIWGLALWLVVRLILRKFRPPVRSES